MRGTVHPDAGRVTGKPKSVYDGLLERGEDGMTIEVEKRYNSFVKSARKTVAAILVALMVGSVAPTVWASAARFPALPQFGTIGAPKLLSSAEFATETFIARQLLSKRVERHGSESLALPSRFDTINLVHARARLITSCPTTDTVARAAIRGRAPPV